MSSSAGSSSKDLISQVSSSATAKKEHGAEVTLDDVLEQNRSVQDGVFTCMHLLTMSRGPVSLKISAIKIMLEALQCFLVVFNPTKGWIIQQDLWLWKAISWVLFQIPVLNQGYGTQIAVLYIIMTIVMSFTGLTVYAAVQLRKDEQAYLEMKKLVRTLQFTAEWLFGVCYIGIFSFLITLFDCNWPAFPNINMLMYPDVQCLASPHIIHMLAALLTACLLAFISMLLSVASCETNPCARNFMASPHAIIRMKSLIVRLVAILVCGINCIPSIQSPIAMIGRAYVLWIHLSAMPYLNHWANHFQICVWSLLTYSSVMWVILLFSQDTNDPAFRLQITQGILYGVWPVGLGAIGISIVTLRFIKRPLALFLNAPPGAKSKDIYRFKSPHEVEILSRIMRKWDLDNVQDPLATEQGEFILKCGLSQFPGSPFLMTLYANLLIERHDGGRARTQLMQCAKNNPTVIDQYFNFATEQLSKRLKDESQGANMDLLSYVEYCKSYRSVVRAHKFALQAQRRFWHELLRPDVKLDHLERALRTMDTCEQGAALVYRRVLEQYPKSGKLLRAYGKFLEDVQNDPWEATKYYSNAEKLGLEDSLIGLTRTSDSTSDRALFLSTLDDKTDGVIVINAHGVIMMVSQVATAMFGYEKGELEGKNVSCLMPAPFALNHNTYISKFIAGVPGAHIDNLNNVVVLNKDRSIMPATLGVTHMVGEGAESVFMGIFKPYKETANVVKMWLLPKTGTVLCAEQGYSDWFGKAASELLGTSIATLGPDTDALLQLVVQVTNWVAAEEGAVAAVVLGGAGSGRVRENGCLMAIEGNETNGTFKLRTRLHHKYMDAVECELLAAPTASKMEPYIVVEIRLVEKQPPLLVVDGKGRVAYANQDLAALLEYPHKQLLTMDLNELIPAPFAQLHKEWLGHAVGSRAASRGCRTGQTVDLVNASGTHVPVTLSLSQREVGDQVQHVVKVFRSTPEAAFSDKRLLLTIDTRGNCESVNDPAATVFGFPASTLVGKNIATFVNAFEGFVDKFGQEELTPLLGKLIERTENHPGMCWRVGVQAPRDKNHRTVARSNMFLSRRNRDALKAAVMYLDIVVGDADDEDDPDKAKLQLQLWRADLVTGVIEVDQNLMILKADAMMGLMFSTSHQAMQRQLLGRYLQLPDGADKSDLMGKEPRGAMKGSKGVWKVGTLREVPGRHVDRGPLGLLVQAVSRTAQVETRVIAKVAIAKPHPGSTDMFHDMLTEPEGEHIYDNNPGAADAAWGHTAGAAAAGRSSTTQPARLLKSATKAPAQLPRGDLPDNKAEADSRSASSHSSGSPRTPRAELANQVTVSRKRTEDWLTAAEPDDDPAAGSSSGQHLAPQSLGAVSPATTTQEDGGQRDVYETAQAALGDVAGPMVRGETDGGTSSGAGDMEGGKDEDLTADFRRAKRLRKLKAMLTSAGARYATDRFKSVTWITLGVMLLAHVICFIVFMQQVNAQNVYISQVDLLGKAVDTVNLMSNSANSARACQLPMWANMTSCSGKVDTRIAQLNAETVLLTQAHHNLYLGAGGTLSKFIDPTIYNLWTTPSLTDQMYEDILPSPVVVNETVALWEMGNRFLAAANDVVYSAKILGTQLDASRSYNYLQLNGPYSLYDGYCKSLDMMVAFAWNSLSGLQTVIIVILVIEALVVQVISNLCELVMLQRSRRETMRTFGVFLTLPSALVRTMAARPTKVDEDELDDNASDDGLDDPQQAAAAAEQHGAAAAAAAMTKPVEKSVRVLVETDMQEFGHEASDLLATTKNKFAGSAGGRPATGRKAVTHTHHRSLRSRLRHVFDFAMVAKYRANGKSLAPNPTALIKFMVPLGLWWIGIILIYAMSFVNLSGLQQPLGQLNMAQKVMYYGSRVRNWASFAVFAEDAATNQMYSNTMAQDALQLKASYNTLLYGGPMNNSYLPGAQVTASVFENPQLAYMFFRDPNCQRVDQSGCYNQSSQYYDITHSGLDAMMLEFLDEARLLCIDPPAVTTPDSPRYQYIVNVAGMDLYDGLNTVASLFTSSTVTQYQAVQTLHIILMVASVVLVLSYILLVFRPYLKRVHQQACAVAAILSQLPPEVDIEGQVRGMIKQEIADRAVVKHAVRGVEDDKDE